MAHSNTTCSFSLKLFLMFIAGLFAVAAIILIISASSAATATGSAPALAVTLVQGANTGLMTPGEQRWFRYSTGQPGQNGNLEGALTLIFTPDNGQRANNVHLQIFDENQLSFYYFGNTSRMANLGTGQIVSRDNNPETGELFWTGWLPSQQNYYVQLVNGSEVGIDYWLFTANVTNYALGDSASSAAPVAALPVATPPIQVASDQPPLLTPGVTRQSLPPNSTQWYRFIGNGAPTQNQFVDMSFTLFFTPGDGNSGPAVNFELFPGEALAQWQRGEANQLANFGAGTVVSRDGDPLTSERLWRGVVLRDSSYLLAVKNASAVTVDFWLFEGDLEHPQFSP
jgi:hypothetical protein